jgi:hypothetical protein
MEKVEREKRIEKKSEETLSGTGREEKRKRVKIRRNSQFP